MKIRNIRQLDTTDCAAACLAIISKYYGLELTVSKLRDICGTDAKGTNVHSIVMSAYKLNYEAKPVRVNKDDFMNKNIRLPLIAHGVTKYGMTHYIVVTRIAKKHIHICDPASNKKKLTIEEFFDFFDGVCVLLSPNSDFVGEKTKTKNILFKFLKLLTPHKGLFISAIIASLVLTILGIASNFFNQILIDEILPYNLRNQLTIFCIGFLIISIINIVLSALRKHILLYLSQKIDIPLTLGYFKHIFALPMKFFSTRKTGDVIARFQDAGTIKNIMSGIALSLLIDITLASVVGIILYFMNSKLFIIVLIIMVINFVLVFIFRQPYKKINEIQMEQSAKLSSSMIESLQGVEMIKTNSIQNERMGIIENNYIDAVKTSFKENVLANVQGTLSGAISILSNLVIMWVGATLVMDGNITLGALMSFTSMAGMFTDPIGRIIGLQVQIQEAGISMRRLNEIYEIDEEDLEEIETLNSLKGDIKINNVSFAYSSRENVINSLSLEIKDGQKVALVGESGCGKTTLSKLLFGLYELNEGNIEINSRDIKDIGLYSLRKRISYVSQNVNFFSGTIKENLKAINPKVSDDKLRAILKLSGCDFILKMPAGIDTYLEEAGNNLSGGERQRLAFARALVKDFDILVLDEATSNLDFLSESILYNTLFNSNINATMIIIAHRLSTIRKCDVIHVMDKGKIIESGNHEELLTKKGLYYKLWISQVGSDVEVNQEKNVGVEVMSYE